MKIGFTKSGLTFNSKKFDPLNLTVREHGIESDIEIKNVKDIDPLEILNDLASCKNEEITKMDKIKILQSTIKKVGNF